MKSVIDLICCWPEHLDFPLFRKFIKENRDKFNKVIIVFTDMSIRDPDYRIYVKEAMASDAITFLESSRQEANQDWRDKAVNLALTHSKAEWVYFTEQDFMPTEGFWREVRGLMQRTDAFGRYQEGRLHPCCLFIKRELLDKTNQDFSAYPDKGMDHFGMIQKYLDGKEILCGVIFSQFGFHMNGLSQNLHMLQTGVEPNYNPPEFRKYVEDCLKEDMPPEMRELFNEYLSR